MIKSLRERLNELLIGSGLLTEEGLKRALGIQKERGGALGKILVEERMLTEADLMSIMSRGLDIPPINLSKLKVPREALQLVPEQIAKHNHLLPISKFKDTLTIAMSDPLNIYAIDDLKTLTGLRIDTVLASDADILNAIDASYGAGSILEPSWISIKTDLDREPLESAEEEKINLSELTGESRKAPIVKMVDLIIVEALKKRASDIHIEPCEDRLRVRYRIDGDLREAWDLPKANQNALLARLKILSGLDITESRVPQDGRFKVRLESREIDFRVSVLPITFGGKVVMRALDRASVQAGLEQLGFLPEPLKQFEEAVSRPYGMILVTGPTGSGKSTTLYSVLNKLNSPDRNIVTIEDPVEYLIEGLTQVQVNPEIGLTFANGLRAILRQSPDTIMIGEIRDGETADIAVKASLTGQFVLSTLHTNDAVGAITRLVDMGVEPFLLASSLIAACAQRLLRRICEECKAPEEATDETLKGFGVNRKDLFGGPFYRGRGCGHCSNTGYYGRLGVLEVLMLDDAIREMIIARASQDELSNYARKHGMLPLRQEALRVCANGLTTLEEALRVTAGE